MEEINKLYNEIEKCNNWNNKIELINKINKLINEENININAKIDSLDDFVKLKKKNTIDIDELMNEFNTTTDLNIKISIYQNLNTFINKLNNNLFTT